MKIRKIENKDRPQVVELWRAVFADNQPHNAPDQVLAEKLKVDDMIFVAEHNEQVVGACIAGYDGHRGWLYSVAVDRSARRDGIGSALVKYTLDYLNNIGCSKVNIQVRTSNTEVVSFYESLGFNVEDRISMGVFVE